MKKVTSIVIGAGLRGGHVYSQYALDHPDEFQVVAVAEPDKERRESFAKRHNIPEELCFESYEELLGKEKLADCAMICTMDRMHYEPTIMALKKGYHVLCEKPMSPDKKEIRPYSVRVPRTSVFSVLFQIKRTSGRRQNRKTYDYPAYGRGRLLASGT